MSANGVLVMMAALAALALSSAELYPASSTSPPVCSLHGAQHVLMTDGASKFTFQDTGLFRVFRAFGPSGASIDIQCEAKRSPASLDTVYSSISACRILLTSSSGCGTDIRFEGNSTVSVHGSVHQLTAIPSLDASLNAKLYMTGADSIAVEVNWGSSGFLSVSMSPLVLTIVGSASITTCDGLCGTCHGPQHAPEDHKVPAYVASCVVSPADAIEPRPACASSTAFPAATGSVPAPASRYPHAIVQAANVSRTILSPVFQTAAAREDATRTCAGGDMTRISDDALFGSFVEDCIYDRSTGPVDGPFLASGSMRAFVRLTEDKQRVASVVAAGAATNPTLCAACIPVEWEKPMGTGVLPLMSITETPEESFKANNTVRSFYDPKYGRQMDQAAPRAPWLTEKRQATNQLYAQAARSLYDRQAAPVLSSREPLPAALAGTRAPILANQNLHPISTSKAPALNGSDVSPVSGTIAPSPASATPIPASIAPSNSPIPSILSLSDSLSAPVSTPVPTTSSAPNSTMPNGTVAPITKATLSATESASVPSHSGSTGPTNGTSSPVPTGSVALATTGSTPAPTTGSILPATGSQVMSANSSTAAPITPIPTNGSSSSPTGLNGLPTTPRTESNASSTSTPVPLGNASAPTPSTSASTPTPSTSASTPTPSTSTSTPTPSTSTSTPTPSTSTSTPTPSTSTSAPTPSTSTSTPTPSTSASPSTNASTAALPGSTTTPIPSTSTSTPIPSASSSAPTTSGSSASPTNNTTPSPTTSSGLPTNVSTPAPTGSTPLIVSNVTEGSNPPTSAPGITPAPANATSSPVPTGGLAEPINAIVAPSVSPIPNGTANSTFPLDMPTIATAKPANAVQNLTASPKVMPNINVTATVPPMPSIVPFNSNITRSDAPDLKPFFSTQMPSVYECHCMNLSVGDVREARDFVEYAMESKLLPQVRESVKCQDNPKLLAVLSCNVEPALNVIIGMPRDQVSALCLVAQVEKSPKKQIDLIVPGLPHATYMQNTRIPAQSVGKTQLRTQDQQYESALPRKAPVDIRSKRQDQQYESALPRKAPVDIRSKRTYVGTPIRPIRRNSAINY